MSKKKRKGKGRLENKSDRRLVTAETERQPRKAEAQSGGKAKKVSVSPWIMAGLILLLAGLAVLIWLRSPRLDLKAAPSYNLLLITLDTTRADHLGCYGDKGARTPNLDRLAAEGWRFNRVYCSAPLTLPSHATILTGLEPVAHSIRNNGHYLPAGVKTITELLAARGYKTAAFVSSFSVDSRFGLDRGFEVYDDSFEADLPFKTNNAERRAEATIARFSTWLENN